MNGWLIFFAFPISTIILSITMQKLIKSPILVASVFFAIYLIVAFAVFNAFFIIYAFVYAIFAYITAIMTQMVVQYIQCNNKKGNNNLNKCTTNSIANTGSTTNIRVRVAPVNSCYNNRRHYR